ncbi:hypothetical protein J1605_010772 [Eschrichtius robustus]|uniref:Transketolase signature 1 domain-containing protein n=1 Tax=Eschrichtius robustus TaxID=9764 RepID=A0AB34GNZ2_ESCRO|nr:hypothetical protein J1605_010772 [Eschrichtius robustus]
MGAACGTAYAGEYWARARYRVFCLLGDGEASQGSGREASASAAHYSLDNLVAVFHVNRLGQSGVPRPEAPRRHLSASPRSLWVEHAGSEWMARTWRPRATRFAKRLE